MSGIRPRTAWVTAMAAALIAGGALNAAPAQAVAGTAAATDGAYAFAAKLDIGAGKRSCSGSLVDKQWVLTAASCFADDPAKGFRVAEGAPKWQTKATVGRTDLAGSAGSVTDVVELVPYEGRDLVMAKLATPVAGVTPVPVGSTAPTKGEELKVSGFGRTKTQWVPDKLHGAAFTVDSVQSDSIGISGLRTSSVCKGDTGGPALREAPGGVELVAVNSTSWQGGCLGTAPSETRTNAVDARVDDLNTWVQKVRYRTVFPHSPWNKATHIASGYFTGGSAGGTRHMDMIVRWIDGEVTLYQGADDKDARHPFTAEFQLAKAKSTWKYAKQITGAGFGGGSDGLVVRWIDGELTQYTHVDQKGFHGEKKLAPAKNKTWPNAKQITGGRYTANAQRDDLIVTWADGEVSLYTDLNTKGLSGKKNLAKAKNKTWPHAEQISAGEFTGKKTADLLVRWSDGEVTIYPGVDTAGFHGEIKVRPAKSPWIKATVVTAGAFVANDRPNDVLVRWENGTLGLYPGVNAAGTHGEIKIVG
ncbi:S1 family peptidase [Streptomyces piniterrae]|uniref:S1 family peptidase n=1 Tax=Streptomyces piniterrae TaxID=2571125 RepID=A0A4U0NRD0_9ACTN|nr:S1 family peptidase [Streptomyces piniterrae]TJZ57043.1 S1 family peptidase [Streptomyces piniterrae]